MAVTRVGLEAGPLSQWLHAGLTAAGFAAVLLETRHVKAALSAMVVKTDRKDARGIAQLLRMGWFRSVHRKSPDAQEVRALLVGRKLLQAKLRDVELSIRGILRGFGLKVGEVSKGRFAARVEELVAGHEMLETVIGAMLPAREGLRAEFARLHRRMLAIVRDDAVCRRLMTVPGVGALVAITFKTAVDDPGRFRTAKAVGAHFGLTPKRYQSGETDVTGGISKVGDAMVRTALYEAANAMLTRTPRLGAQALGPGGGQATRREAGEGGAWRASWPASCTACGRTPPTSAGARRRPRRSVAGRTGLGRDRAVLLLRGPVAGTREPVRPGVVLWAPRLGAPRALDWPTGSFLTA